jgi:aminomethyltransferase
MNIVKIPLDSLHRQLGARMVPFAGFEMPVNYKGILEEHHCVRKNVGIFDISHMGILVVRGSGTLKFLDKMISKPVSKVSVGKGAYALLCNEDGNTRDDLIFYRAQENEVYLALNASNKEEDFKWLQKHASSDVEFESRFTSHALFALQGARAPDFLKTLGLDLNYSQLYSTSKFQIAGVDCLFFVSGYTGEKGCEISVPVSGAEKVFSFFLDKGKEFSIQPIGLGARDTLRTEMGYSLYGHELNQNINPVEAGLSWALDLTSNFIGSESLRRIKEKPLRKLIALRNINSKQAPRSEMKIFDSQQKEVGFITSGTFAPSLGYAIGLGIIDVQSQAPYSIDIRGQKVPYELVKRPFYVKSC